MAKLGEGSGGISVLVMVAPFLQRFADSKEKDGESLQRYVGRYLNDMVEDLKIPASILLDVKVGEAKNGFTMNSYEVFISEVKCRLLLPTKVAKDVQARELARSISRVIYQNRELVLTVSVAKKILEKWWSEEKQEDLTDLSVEKFHAFLLKLVCRNYRINRGKIVIQALKDKTQKEWNDEEYFEKAVSEVDALAIGVSHGEDVKEKSEADDERPIDELFDMMQDGLFYELGITLPKVGIGKATYLEHGEFRIKLNDLRLPPMLGLKSDEFLVDNSPDRLSLLHVTGKGAVNPASGRECAIVQKRDGALERCQNAGLTTWGQGGFIVLSLSAEIKTIAGAFLNTQAVESSMSLLRQAYPTVVDTALMRFDVTFLTQILRDLLDEEISIRDLRGILEILLAIDGTTGVDQSKYIVFFPNIRNLCPVSTDKQIMDLEVSDYANCVRMYSKRYISYKYTMGENTLVVYLIDPKIEERIRQIHERPLSGEEYNRLIGAIFKEVRDVSPTVNYPVVLTTLDVRKTLRNLIRKEFPRLAVLSYQELSPDMNIRPLARISWD